MYKCIRLITTVGATCFGFHFFKS